MDIPVLLTERLRLDAVTEDDSAAVLEYCSDVTLQSFVPVPVPYTEQDAHSYTVGYAGKAPHLWAMREPIHGLVGVIELKPHPLASAELGFWLGAPFRGSGYMTEAARAVVDFGFSELALEHILWCAVVGNVASAVVARRTGFTFEGTRRLALEHRDHRLDGWFGSLLPADDRAEKPGWPA